MIDFPRSHDAVDIIIQKLAAEKLHQGETPVQRRETTPSEIEKTPPVKKLSIFNWLPLFRHKK
jgi:hypothetical protein